MSEDPLGTDESADETDACSIDRRWGMYPEGYGESSPAAALVRLLKGRRVVDASCDGEGKDDVRLLLDNGVVVAIDSDLALDEYSQRMAREIGRPVPWSRLVVASGEPAELWPFETEWEQLDSPVTGSVR